MTPNQAQSLIIATRVTTAITTSEASIIPSLVTDVMLKSFISMTSQSNSLMDGFEGDGQMIMVMVMTVDVNLAVVFPRGKK